MLGGSLMSKGKTFAKTLVGLFATVGLCFGGAYVYMNVLPISVTVDGENMQAHRIMTVGDLAKQGNLKAKAGNLIAVDGSIITEGGGETATFTIDGSVVSETTHLSSGDSISGISGADVTEAYDMTETKSSYSTDWNGENLHRALCVETTNGQELIVEHRVGKVSGKSADVVVQEQVNRVISCYTGTGQVSGKKIAITFDDGPSEYTPQVLDVLKEYGVKATFFELGKNIEAYQDYAKRVVSEGHQLATHTWDHAEGSGKGVNLTYMSDDEVLEEVQKGLDEIEKVTGVKSTVMRAPGGNFSTHLWDVLDGTITAEIDWDVDTVDWSKPGTASIVKKMESVEAGQIILCHDGGGDRSQTVEALKEAIPYLLKQGYEFVTVDELIADAKVPMNQE